MSVKDQFINDAEKKAFDTKHRQTINFNIDKYHKSVAKGQQQYAEGKLELARKKAKNIKWQTMERLDYYLLEFERVFTSRGGKVIWASTADDAMEVINKIVKESGATSVVKSKSMVTEEIELNERLEKQNIKVFETDLGEYIVQLAGEKPYHIVTPAMHKSKEDIADLFHRKLETAPNLSPEELTLIARKELREKYLSSYVGITGANFLVSDVGGIAITANEGNARLTTAYPRIHIAIVGIEKMIPSINDLPHFWPLLSTFGTGQRLTVYNTLLLGPRQANETDGPEEMYVILLDNGRTDILADPKKRESLYCIRCGACLNACPIYKNIGGHSYGTTYSGPIGSVITPNMKNRDEYQHLSQASSLCGKCTESCPVNIQLHNMLLYNRKDSMEQNLNDTAENMSWKIWKKAMLSRKNMNRGGSGIKNLLFKLIFKNSWGKRRNIPKLPKKSFNQLWQQQQKGK